MKRIILLCLVIVLLTPFAVDRFGRFSIHGIVYVANTYSVISTPDFTFINAINSHGFRGVELVDDARCRVAVLGNSYAYGWGVNETDVWTHHLGHMAEVQVFNLAAPYGRLPDMQAIAKRSQYLEPDVWLIGIQQYADLHTRERYAQTLPIRVTDNNALRRLYPNLSNLLPPNAQNIDMQVGRSGLEAGADTYPNALYEASDTVSMASEIEYAVEVVQSIGQNVAVFNIPESPYADAERFVMYNVEYENIPADNLIRIIAQQASVPYIGASGVLRSGDYFVFDWHMNARGNYKFAAHVAPFVRDLCGSQRNNALF
jgi:hypothetical protein